MDSITQYCPVAVGAEIFGDRWTPLILREFIVGAHTFGEIHNGIPHISRALLAGRLRQLVAQGLVTRREDQPGKPRYYLTPAGADLQDVLMSLGNWAIRWAYFQDPTDQQIDNVQLMWRVGRGVLHERIPGRRVVIEFELTCPSGVVERFWLVIEPDNVDTCLKPPGFDTDVAVRTTSRELYRLWMGRTTIPQAVGAGTLEIEGPRPLVRAFPRWFSFSPFAPAMQKAVMAESLSVPA